MQQTSGFKITREWHATIHRCTCKDKTLHRGQPCPNPKIEEIGNVKRWPLRHPLLALKFLFMRLKG